MRLSEDGFTQQKTSKNQQQTKQLRDGSPYLQFRNDEFSLLSIHKEGYYIKLTGRL